MYYLGKKKNYDHNPAIAIICLCIKVIVAKMSGKKMMKGQITILNQILIISMEDNNPKADLDNINAYSKFG